MTAESAKSDVNALLEFMIRLGQAHLASGEQTAKVELLLRRTAAACGVRRSRVVAFPTALFVSVYYGANERVTLAEGPTQTLRLDQIAGVYTLGDLAQRGEIAPREGLARLNEILHATSRFGGVGAVVGHIVLSVGVAMVLAPTQTNIAAATVLGAVVGVVKTLQRNRPVLAAPLPVVTAAIVSALVFLAVEYGLPVDPLHAMAPPLVTFLPGAMLTLGMVELAYGDMVSGSSRLMTGLVQLILLAFGLAAGAVLVGYRPDNLIDASRILEAPEWTFLAPLLGVVVFGVGVYIHFSAPPRSLVWMLLVLIAAFAVQQAAAGVFGKAGSGFFGMLVATPLGYLIQLRFRGPPAMVTFLPSFWLLVPGAFGLLSFQHMMNDRNAGLEALMSVVFVLASTALGTLMGAALYKSATERFGSWQMQIGRV
ncbi:MAG TPA: threonine/serine exporter family protein, partial [Lacipirellulaceae bacterium]|nr:threonine/serine exporter family protein [Lacipirellulaceae bacterium]